MNEVKAKAKEITEKVWFKRLSTIGIIIFSIGSPAYALMVYSLLSEGNNLALGFISFISSVISSLILFFIIRFIFYRLSPMGKMILLPLMWITGLPGFIAFVIWFNFLFIITLSEIIN